LESFKSPIEITTVFFVLSIAFYVALFWWAQAKARAENKSTVRIPQRRASDRPLLQRPPPAVSIDQFEDLTLTRIFEDDSDTGATTH
jgi:hypothetical protein